ncbi:MAG: hypothetical protein R3Y36_03605 [Spirochaetales bacterium]
MIRKFITIFFVTFTVMGYAQENIDYFASLDDLFLDPVQDIEESFIQEEVISRIEEPEIVQLKGYFGGTAGFGISFFESGHESADEIYEFLLGASADASITVTARPHKSVRIRGILETTLDESNLDKPWDSVEISELFLEYNLLDTAFITFGKFSTSVGNSFISKSTGASFLISLPTVLSGLNFYANADSSAMQDNEYTAKTEIFDYRRLFVGAWGDAVFGSTRFTFGAQYQKKDDLAPENRFGALFGLQTKIGPINLTSEVRYFSIEDHLFYADIGLYYMYKNLYVSAAYETEKSIFGNDSLIHAAELYLGYSSVFNSAFNFGFVSKLQIDTLSGVIIPIITVSPWQYVTLSVGMPYFFGENGLDVYNDVSDDETTLQNITGHFSILASISVKITF